MEGEILNRVANSKLATLDLEDFYPEGQRDVVDVSPWLFEGFILKEKDFRAHVKQHDWSSYKGNYVAITCSTDAIIPGWATMLIASEVSPFAKKVVVGNLEMLETVLFTEIIQSFDTSEYKDKPVIIKGCSNKPIPDTAFTLLVQKLQPLAKSILYGEACSSVPLYKKK